MTRYLARRIGYLLVTIGVVSFIVFGMLHFTPGDPATLILGNMSTEAARESLREQLGLNDSFFVQYFNFMKNLIFHQDLGDSYITQRPVLQEIFEVLPNTILLSTIAILIAVVFGVTLGVISAVKQYSVIDAFVTIFAMIGTSAPIFWYGLLMILLFSVHLGWFPPSGFDTPREMFLPCLALGIQSMSMITRMTRSSMLEVIRMDFVKLARAKGQKEIVVIFHHVLRNALIPIITIIGLQFGFLLAGALFLEVIFSIPGLGRLMIEAIKMRDYPIVMGGVFFMALSVTVVNLITDILYAVVDPRIARS